MLLLLFFLLGKIFSILMVRNFSITQLLSLQMHLEVCKEKPLGPFQTIQTSSPQVHSDFDGLEQFLLRF